MKKASLLMLGVLLLALGVVGIAYALVSGQAHFALVLFIPVFYSNSALLALASLSVLGGFFCLFTSLASVEWEGTRSPPYSSTGGPPSTKAETSIGGFVLVGPVPIVFGNRSQLLPYVILMGVLTVVAVFLILYLG